MKRKHLSVWAIVGLAALLYVPSPAWAQSLGSASSFAVLGGAAVTAAGGVGTIITGDVGVSPGTSITGFPPAVVAPGFFIHPNDAVAIAAQSSVGTLYASLVSASCAAPSLAQLSGATFTPGTYCFSSTADLAATGVLTLNGSGTYIFQVGSALTANVNSSVSLQGGANACSVFWQVTSAATLNGVNFAGNVVALSGVTVGVGARLTGRALVRPAGPVTMAGGNAVGGCSASGVPPPVILPTLAKAFNPVVIGVGGVSTLTITLGNPNTSVATLTAPLIDTLPSGVVIAAPPNANTTCGGSGAVVATAGGTTATLPAGRSIPAGGACTVTVNVTASAVGSYVDVLAANALQTTNGNNPTTAVATLTVVAPGGPPVSLAKAFSPVLIGVGGVSTLTITLVNTSSGVATLTAPLIDTLPSGVVIAAPPNANTTCGGSGAVVATAGGTTATLPAGRSIPAVGTCTVTVNVTGSTVGSFLNTLAANALQTNVGNNPAPAVATLTVGAATPVPTLSEWAMIVLTALLALVGFAALRRRARA
jgi:hypothetical protein